MSFWPKARPSKLYIAAFAFSLSVAGSGAAFAEPVFAYTTQAQSSVTEADHSIAVQNLSKETGSILKYPKVDIATIPAATSSSVSSPTQSVNDSSSISTDSKTDPVTAPAESPVSSQVQIQSEGTVAVEATQETSVPAVCADIRPGQAWAGVGTVCKPLRDSTTPAPPVGDEYTMLIRNIVAPWCPNINLIIDDPSVTSGNVYGMMWWGTDKMAIRSGLPLAMIKDFALHECGHMLQARLYPNKWEAVNRMNAIYGHSDGIETNARCISAYLHPGAQPMGVGTGATARWHSAECAGAYGQAAIKVVQGVRP